MRLERRRGDRREIQAVQAELRQKLKEYDTMWEGYSARIDVANRRI